MPQYPNQSDALRCRLEVYYRTTLEQGEQVGEHLRAGVEQALTPLANGFLSGSYRPSDPLLFYGADKNPPAVELARVVLWIESHDVAQSLTFLDHRIKCDASLVGVSDLNVIGVGIPDTAFQSLSTDNNQITAGICKRNRHEQAGQIEMALFDQQLDPDLGTLDRLMMEVDAIPSGVPR